MSILLYGCTAWTLTKCMKKKLDRNYKRMLWAVLHKSWKQCPIKLYCHLHPISLSIQVRWTRCWRGKAELMWHSPTCGCISVGWPAKTYIHQLCLDTEGRLKDWPRTMRDMNEWSALVWFYGSSTIVAH